MGRYEILLEKRKLRRQWRDKLINEAHQEETSPSTLIRSEEPIIVEEKHSRFKLHYVPLGITLFLAWGTLGSLYYGWQLKNELETQNHYITKLENQIIENNKVIEIQNNINKELKDQLLSQRIVITEQEKILLEKLVEAEAGDEPYIGKVAVVNVVFNRLASSYYPNSITEVIFQPHQFTPAHQGKLKYITPSPASIKAVEEALNGKRVVPKETLFFVSLDKASDFTIPNTRVRIMDIGGHTFYK